MILLQQLTHNTHRRHTLSEHARPIKSNQTHTGNSSAEDSSPHGSHRPSTKRNMLLISHSQAIRSTHVRNICTMSLHNPWARRVTTNDIKKVQHWRPSRPCEYFCYLGIAAVDEGAHSCKLKRCWKKNTGKWTPIIDTLFTAKRITSVEGNTKISVWHCRVHTSTAGFQYPRTVHLCRGHARVSPFVFRAVQGRAKGE